MGLVAETGGVSHIQGLETDLGLGVKLFPSQ